MITEDNQKQSETGEKSNLEIRKLSWVCFCPRILGGLHGMRHLDVKQKALAHWLKKSVNGLPEQLNSKRGNSEKE